MFSSLNDKPVLSIFSRCFVLCAILGFLLWSLFGAHWFSFYGYSFVLLLGVLSVVWLSRKVSKDKKASRLFYISSFILSIICLVHVGYWFLFFRLGPTNPELGLLREMLRPTLAVYGTYILTSLILLWVLLAARALGQVES